MAKSEDDLKEAFAGESQANRKYLAFAKKADQEGYAQVAKLFRAAAEAETVHAHNHLREMGGIRSNAGEPGGGRKRRGLRVPEDVSGDDRERPRPRATRAPEKTFTYANEVEKVHAALYKKAIEELGKNPQADYYVCQTCGNTFEGEPPDKCPVCGAVKSSFKKMD